MIREYWGQEVREIDGSSKPRVFETIINRGIWWEEGKKPRVGISEKIVSELMRLDPDAILIIDCLEPEVKFSIPVWKIKKCESEEFILPRSGDKAKMYQVPI